ncbi:FUSC family protein [Methyloligella solikamskensis]|uniref:Aromatic acid exporter family protein n=1 Tax=Methyloligella solikamskensis TaxID=1177756 RepID=A0ABW3J5N0_9HYPH
MADTNFWRWKLHMRWREGLKEASACAAAAGIAWFLAQLLFGHPTPVFAAVSAIVCLSPGLPNHVRQAAGLMTGVAVGIVVGELALLAPDTLPVLRMVAATFFSILLASVFGAPPVVPIQAGVSAVLVLAIGSDTAGVVRLMDVVVGAAAGLFFSQVVMTPDPIRSINQIAERLLRDLSGGLRSCAKALSDDDLDEANAALHSLSLAHADLVGLGTGIKAARSDARWSLRGRMAAEEVQELAARYERHAIRLYASSLLFAEAMANAIRKGANEPPDSLKQRILLIAEKCDTLAARGSFGPQSAMRDLPPLAEIVPKDRLWSPVIHRLELMEDALAAFGRPSPVSDD